MTPKDLPELTEDRIASIAAELEVLDPHDRVWVDFARAVEAELGARSTAAQPVPGKAAHNALPLVARLRNTPNWMRESYGSWKDCVLTYDRSPFEAADRIEELESFAALFDCQGPDGPTDPAAVIEMLRGWEVDATARGDRLAAHLRQVLEIARTWQPDYATKMDRDTLAFAAEAIEDAAPPAASGEATPPSAPVQGDPSGALRPEPEAVGQGRWWRKRPVVVEAFQWDGMEAGCQAAKARFPELETHAKNGWTNGRPEVTYWRIGTLEGSHVVSPGDWIIRGVKGEMYPCKPDIFAATYEPAEPPQAASGERGD